MPDEKLIVGVIGVGPIGTILASCLAEAGAEILAADLPHRLSHVKKQGLQMQWGEKRIEHRVSTADSIRSMAQAHPDFILIATKASILERIMPEVAEAAGRTCLVISAQNGIDPEDVIAGYVPPQNVCRMVINYAGGNDEKGVAHVNWFNPPNYFGFLVEHEDPKLKRFVEMLTSSGLTSELVDPITIKKKAFLKTVLNSSLMPLCAVMGLTMKEAMEGKATRSLVRDLVREGLDVASRLGYDYGEGILDQCMGYLDQGGSHHPSMSVDLKNKLLTEIDFINGKILEIGQRYEDLDLPVNRVMTSLVMSQEVINRTRKPDAIPGYVVGTRQT